MPLQLCQHLGDHVGIQAVFGQAGGHAHALEEIAGGLDGRIDALIVVTFLQAPDAGGVLQQLLALDLAAFGQ
ncbi:hypothetical protein D3C76_1691870 [compost metagenome]